MDDLILAHGVFMDCQSDNNGYYQYIQSYNTLHQILLLADLIK